MDSLTGGRQKLLDLSIGQKVIHAKIYSQCFHMISASFWDLEIS